MKKCPFCAEEIQEEAIKCKHCGSILKIDTDRLPSTETKKARLEGFSIGCLVSSMTFIIFFGIGSVLTLTGVGAIIGIPMMLLACILPFVASPLIALFIIQGECPYCGTKVLCFKKQESIKCRSCRNVILIREGRYIRTN